MLERRWQGEIPTKPHTLFKPQGAEAPAYEYVFTRDGFAGGFSILYLKHEPNAIKEHRLYRGDAKRLIGEAVSYETMPLARRHIKSWEAPEGSHFIASRTALFLNATTRVSVLRGVARGDGDQGESYAFANWHADELYFVFAGKGRLLTPFGELSYSENDYLLIPKGIPYRFLHEGKTEMLIFEGTQHLEIPAEFRNPHGQLKLEAPYTHRDFASPTRLEALIGGDHFMRIVSLANGQLTEHSYERPPFQTLGWDGSVYPLRFSILDYLPKTGKIHLPPNLHMTFKSRDFVVCSFVPRMVDYGENAIPCPYPHANVHCDEIIYYVRGNFTSRKGISPRSVSHHPVGQPHGPQPGNYLKSLGAKQTDELAVMLDTWQPLQLTKAALGIEDASYQTSWTE